ncbi:hypothetical protein A9798_08710 [Edwardsiella hoshinae]|uniref:Uncharacterized protein n=1 Tax=Edwardsiella hoshinae TaxID=93378 RepID=A0ABM6EJG6_9GAMM|nr:hypothetical protein A9798_08710 [Edwardsiella hoshinae]
MILRRYAHRLSGICGRTAYYFAYFAVIYPFRRASGKRFPRRRGADAVDILIVAAFAVAMAADGRAAGRNAPRCFFASALD